MAVAGATENRLRTCAEKVGEIHGLECADGYSDLSAAADKCCGGGPSYCPTPQLCANEDAFDPNAQYEYHCHAVVMTQAECPCQFSVHEGTSYCSCPAKDKAECDSMLPGTEAVRAWGGGIST